MNMTKPVQAIVLASAIVILIVMVIFTFRGQNNNPTVPKNDNPSTKEATADGNDNTAQPNPPPEASASGVDWLDSSRVAMTVLEVKGGRNPFENLMASSPPPPEVKPAPPSKNPIIPANGDQPLPDFTETSKTVTLHWISWQQLAAKMKAQIPSLTVTAGNSGQAKLKGLTPDVNDAMAALPSIDVAPPIPPFALVGVIADTTKRYAVITLNGKSFSLYEGESFADGWTVMRITPTGVILQKGKLNTSLRLAGGKA